METVAVYWESKIRTYGFNLQEGLILSRVSLPCADLSCWGETLQSLDAGEATFRLVWAGTGNSGQIVFCLACDAGHWTQLRPLIKRDLDPAGVQVVDILFLQGPHFGDRYGIMDFTYQALAKGPISLISAVCSVATIYLVLPGGWGRKAQSLLAQAFEIPRTTAADKGLEGTRGGADR
jgi:hypothetical protein